MSNELRLPDGTWTEDVCRFSAEWDKVRKPFEDLGFRTIGFDPGIALCDAKTNTGSFEIPLYAAQRIIAAMEAASVRDPGVPPTDDGFEVDVKVGASGPATYGHDGKPWPQTMDANAWATEFCKLNRASDHGTMLGWFANAIMAGHDTALRERKGGSS